MPGALAAIRRSNLSATVPIRNTEWSPLSSRPRRPRPLTCVNANTRTTNPSATVRTRLCKKAETKAGRSFERPAFLFLLDLLAQEGNVRHRDVLEGLRQGRFDEMLDR